MSKERMPVCGTGLSGLIGSRIVELTEDKYQWVNVDLNAGIDITDDQQVENIISSFRGDTVLHLAAFTDVTKAWEQRGDKRGNCYQINVTGTRNIARACSKHQKYLIHVSTEYVFPGDQQEAYTEKDQPFPIEWYGQTKYWAEEEVKSSGCSFVIIRPAFPFRACYGQKLDVVRRMIRGLKDDTLPPMFSDAYITPTFIDDLTVAVEKVIEAKPSRIFHLVGSTSLSPFDLARKVATVFGFEPAAVKEGSLTEYLKVNPKPYHRYLRISNAKAAAELGTHMRTVDEALDVLKNQITQLGLDDCIATT